VQKLPLTLSVTRRAPLQGQNITSQGHEVNVLTLSLWLFIQRQRRLRFLQLQQNCVQQFTERPTALQ